MKVETGKYIYALITSRKMREALAGKNIKWTEKRIHDVRLRFNPQENRMERCYIVDLFAPVRVIADALYLSGMPKEGVDMVIKNAKMATRKGQSILFRTIVTTVAV